MNHARNHPHTLPAERFQFSLLTALASMLVISLALYLHIECDGMIAAFFDSAAAFVASALWLRSTKTVSSPTIDLLLMYVAVMSATLALATSPHAVGVLMRWLFHG